MRRSFIITIAGVLLLAAVICTAGCVETPTDPIVGDWIAETDTAAVYAVFENGGSGYFAAAAETEEAAGMLMENFEWKADGGNTYTLSYADGKTETAALDAEHGIMTIGEIEFQKYPSGYSGLMDSSKMVSYDLKKPGSYGLSDFVAAFIGTPNY